MANFEAPNPNYQDIVKSVVLGFPASRWLGFDIVQLGPGQAELVLPYREELSQGGGIFQAGVIGMLADIAAGTAAGTLLPIGKVLVTCDYTVKLLSPAVGEKLISRGEAIKTGQSLTVSRADVYAVRAGKEKLCATALVTTMAVSLPGGQ